MSEKLKAHTYIKLMDIGGSGSRAQLIKGSDGKNYVMKLIGNPQGTRILGNELVTGKIAKLLDVPCPEVTTIEVDLTMAKNINSVCQTQFVEGIQFAQAYLGDIGQVFPSNNDLMSNVENIGKWANAVVFDALVQNEDMNERHVLVTIDPETKRSYFWHIDHGYCLGIARGWSTLNLDGVFVRKYMYSDFVKGEKPFHEVFEKLDSITVDMLKGLLNDCPLATWGISSDECDKLISYLLSAKEKVRKAIIASKPNFHSWTGDAGSI